MGTGGPQGEDEIGKRKRVKSPDLASILSDPVFFVKPSRKYLYCEVIFMPYKATKRADGRYTVKVSVNGQTRFVYGKTPKEASKKADALRLEAAAGIDLSQDRRLAFWIDRFLARSEQEMTPEWFSVCRARAEVWREALGGADISSVTTADLEDVLLCLRKRNPATGRPSSKKTLTEYKNIICRIFALAAQNRVLTYDPSNYLPKTKNAPQAKREAISDDQIKAILDTPHRARLPCLIMIYAGLRLGEVCALTWSDIDFDRRVIRVNKSYNFKAEQIKQPKTDAGTRVVPIVEPLLSILQDAPRDSILVAHNRGARYTWRAWDRALESYSKELGFRLHAHCLRHTYATILFEAGVDVVTAQAWMGHADSQTTLNIYTHLRESHAKTAVQKLENFTLGCQKVVKTSR